MGSDRYKGEWKDGMMHGKGTFMWSKGDMYEGHWRAGKMHGHGVKKMGNGDVYEGTWLWRRFAGSDATSDKRLVSSSRASPCPPESRRLLAA